MSNEKTPPQPEDRVDAPATPNPALDLREVEALRAKAAQADDYLERLQRTAAEYQNAQKRFLKERDITRKLALRDLLRAFLPSIDNLNRALSSGTGNDQASVLEGIRMVQSEIQRAISDFGFKSLMPLGERLDPNLHEAVSKTPKPGVEDNTVIEVLEPGYVLGDLVVRPARVVVAQGVAPEAASSSEPKENS